jgi:hypothetical protein
MKTRKQPRKTRPPTPYPRAAAQSQQSQSQQQQQHETHVSYMNVSQSWSPGQGMKRNTVTIRNGRGVKRVERLGPQGEVLEIAERPLSQMERQHILQGKFIPGLWRNCKVGC